MYPPQRFGSDGWIQSALPCSRVSPDALGRAVVGSQHHSIQFASLYHTVPAQESGIQLWHQHRRLGVRCVPLCQGPPDPGSTTSVLCAPFSHRGHSTGRGGHGSCGQRGIWNSARRDQRNFSTEVLLEQETLSAVPWLVRSEARGPILMPQ